MHIINLQNEKKTRDLNFKYMFLNDIVCPKLFQILRIDLKNVIKPLFKNFNVTILL